jgi:dolichol-phosphate mannosyltransferase
VLGLGYSAVVVDDSQDDRTAKIAVQQGACVVRRFKKRGLGSAIVAGLRYARLMAGDYAVVMDAGGTHHPRDAQSLAALAQRGNDDVVIGSRFVGKYAWQGWRTALSRVGTGMVRALGVEATDVTCGFRCYRLNDRLFAALGRTKAQGHAFQFELLTNLVRLGARVGEVAISYKVVGKTTLRAATVIEALATWSRLFLER